MLRLNEGVKFSEALYAVDARQLGADFDVGVPDEDGKVSVWVSSHSKSLRERAGFLDVRNSSADFLESLGFTVYAELDPFVQNPYRRRLRCTNDYIPKLFVGLDPEGIEIGLSPSGARHRFEPFLSVRRSFDTVRSERPEAKITGKAMRAVEAIVDGAHIPTALNAFLYEYADGNGPLDGLDGAPDFRCNSATSSRRGRDSDASWIAVPSSEWVDRFSCYESQGGRYRSGTRIPNLVNWETGSVLVAYDLMPTEAAALAAELRAEMERVQDLVKRTQAFVHSPDSIITRGFRTAQEYSRDQVIDALFELGFDCCLPERHFSAALGNHVLCSLDIQSRNLSKEAISVLSVDLGRNAITLLCDRYDELAIPHEAAGGFDDAYSLVKEICCAFEKGTLTKASLLERMPAGWRRIKRGDNEGLSDTFGVGDYIGDGLRMTSSGPVDVGR